MNILKQLPIEFEQFLQSEGIDPTIFECDQTLRYIRIKPNIELSIEQLQQQVSPLIQQIQWIPNMYGLPNDVKISQLPLYRDGYLYGIDLSSAAVVLALDIQSTDHNILEICCAPGAKLTYIADSLQTFTTHDQIIRQVVGVDISQNRINTTQSIVNKYKLDNMVKLLTEDGTTYKADQQFDKVLIDAECTHEGSIKHLKKFIQQHQQQQIKPKKEQKNMKQSIKQLKKNHTNVYLMEQQKPNEWSHQDFIDRFLDPIKLKQISTLQYNLLKNGFMNLKQGGILVYSTCSFSRKQNEDIIIKFIEEHPNAKLLPAFKDNVPCKVGLIEDTARFDPKITNSGGMFVAKLYKN